MLKQTHAFAVLSVITLLAHSAFAWELTGGLEEWDTSPLRPYDVAITTDGTPYFTHWDTPAPDWPAGRLFTLDPADGSLDVYDAPPGWGDVAFQMVDRAPDGVFWLSDPVGGSIVSFDPTADAPFTRYPLPAGEFNLPAGPVGSNYSGTLLDSGLGV